MNEKDWMDYSIELQKQYPIFEEKFREKQAEGKVGVISRGGKGNIPVLFATGANLPEAWENSLIALWARGIFIRTQYDRREGENNLYIDPPSKDCSMKVVIENPMAEPRIHREFPGGLDDLEEYRQEVLDGIKDNWIRDPTNPKDERWEYTYHERLFNYKVPGLEKAINQIEEMTKNLAKSPITRRAQVITWQTWADIHIGDPACLQSIWGRGLRAHPDATFEFYSDETTGELLLNLNQRFRSRDAFFAAFMNNYATTLLGERMAQDISARRKEKVKLGRFIDDSDSYHIYGKDLETFLERFGKGLATRHFYETEEYDEEARTWRSDKGIVQEIFNEARAKIPLKIAEQDAKYAKNIDLTKSSAKLL
jgi:thymidylate synthase